VQSLFEWLQAAGLVVNMERWIFAQPELEFLGHRVNASTITPLPDKVAAIQRQPNPITAQGLMGYLGKVSFYRRFVPGAAHILWLLTDALHSGKPLKSKVQWTEEMEHAFKASKKALCDTMLGKVKLEFNVVKS
jgi:hypothetical protein